jgi:hypothetical protein
MKVTVLSFNAVAAWKWNASTEPHQLYAYASRGPDGQIEEYDDDDEEVCGICQSAFESTCPECKVPGDDCPLSECRMDRADHSMGGMFPYLPHALSAQVARDRVFETAVSDGQAAMG